MELNRTGRTSPAFVVLLCFLVAAIEGYDIQAFGVAASRLVPEFGLDPGQQGWAASAAMIGLVVGAFGGGWLADRIGRRPVLLVSVAGFGLFSVWTAMTHDYASLFLARLLTGLGFGGALPNLIAMATEISSPDRRAATVTTMFCGLPTGGAIVALIARFAGSDLDWRAVFLAGGLAPLLLMPLLFLRLPETRPKVAEGVDRRLVSTLFAQGRTPGTLLIWTVFVLTLIVMYLMLNWLPTLVMAKGFTAADGATASLAFNLVSIVGALLVGFIVDRLGFRWPLLVAYGALAMVMYALAGATGLPMVLALSGAAGFLVMGAQYSLYAVAPMLYPVHARAGGAGAAVAVGRLGSIAGPLLAGELRQAGFTAGQVFGAMTPVVLAAAGAVVALGYLSRMRDD